jgi:hypothetical protein
MDKNSKEYKKAIRDANKIYGEKTSAYRSFFIVKKYKEYGGKFIGKKPSIRTGLKRWREGERWIQVIPYLTKNIIIECGSQTSKKTGKACRPLYIKTNKTPITINELLKIHSKQEILKAARKKEKYPSLRLNWKTLTFSKL